MARTGRPKRPTEFSIEIKVGDFETSSIDESNINKIKELSKELRKIENVFTSFQYNKLTKKGFIQLDWKDWNVWEQISNIFPYVETIIDLKNKTARIYLDFTKDLTKIPPEPYGCD